MHPTAVIKSIVNKPSLFLELLIRLPIIRNLIPDRIAITLLYKMRFGKKPNLKEPQTFNEKLLWLTLYDRRPDYIQMVDKYEAKNWIFTHLTNKLPRDECSKCIIPTYGVYSSFNDINFDKLPDSFVMKTTHDSGSVVLVDDKTKLNINKAREILEKSLKCNYFWFSREWAYKGVKPRIIVEKKLETKEKSPIDYKLYCFNGKAKYLYLVQDRDVQETVDYYDMDWNHLPIKQVYPNNTKRPIKPDCWSKMVEYAEILAFGVPFLRVDFYVDKVGQFYIGELTLTPSSGLLPITPVEWDYRLGQCIDLKCNER